VSTSVARFRERLGGEEVLFIFHMLPASQVLSFVIECIPPATWALDLNILLGKTLLFIFMIELLVIVRIGFLPYLRSR
jgi:hypothetical protein